MEYPMEKNMNDERETGFILQVTKYGACNVEV